MKIEFTVMVKQNDIKRINIMNIDIFLNIKTPKKQNKEYYTHRC